MPLNNHLDISPNDINIYQNQHASIRKRWIQNIIDLLHSCLLKGDIERAKRAWAILVRCREVNWKSRWYWGLLILSSTNDDSSYRNETGSGSRFDQSQRSTFSHGYQGKEVERWLNALRVSAREEDKPSLLHALVLHLIKYGQYRHAYDHLETYLPSYPYLLSGPLHTYAGLLAFYLAQPISSRAESSQQKANDNDQSSSRGSSPSQSLDSRPPDVAGIRQARGWFSKALAIDENDEVAKQFINLIDNPHDKDGVSDDSDEELEKIDENSMEEISEEDEEKSTSEDEEEKGSMSGSEGDWYQ
ncbi:uncharacterized protein IL334_007615 [Kwoniella shivajii]|uniref:Uncharacterized protein n=1 Tax=Kwoniella shivajii TaxID=564305 RepID=A0ABZ1DD37_9TREE|nr:hypothetical protein IL334_007615 [Kwoniella shivajii]